MSAVDLKNIAGRLINTRGKILDSYPFFGRLLMRLPFGFAQCGTAYTDMQRIVFDPAFAAGLSDEELLFVVMHELMHCVLKHCTRGRGRLGVIYNIACDIVVNSIIMEALDLDDFVVGGSGVIHLTPGGSEGRNYNAEEVYEMFIKDNQNPSDYIETLVLDNHEIWDMINEDPLIESIWNSFIKNAGRGVGMGSGIPDSVERYISNIYHTEKISWKQILHDYIQNNHCDYDFSVPDKRFDGDFILPSFCENVYGSMVENIYFFVDTSGSVSDTAIAEAFEEIKDAINQIENMSGYVLFFDAGVSSPFSFEGVEDIEALKPIGGGGTSYIEIFGYISGLQETPPSVVIIITDGYAQFPDESVVPDIPVVWLIVDSDVEAPWGECLHVYTE